MMKTCSQCHCPKPLDQFDLEKHGKYGVRGECKICKADHRRLRNGSKKSTAGTPQRFWARVEKHNGCWIWRGGKDRKGYGKTTWPTKRNVHTHVLAWFLTHGKWPMQCILHHCDNPPCCNPEHLFEGTHRDNAQDRQRKERSNTWKISGENNYHASVTNQQAAEIRLLYASGHYSQYALARMYATSRNVVYCIVHNKKYLK